MNWAQTVDIYCERLDTSFWAEPVNALTNLMFIMAGLFLLVKVRRNYERILCYNLILIGVGSFLFHTFAQHWSGILDVIPIFVFISLSTFGLFYRYMNWKIFQSILASIATVTVSITICTYVFDKLRLSLNGSENYAFALVILVIGAGVARIQSPPSSIFLIAACAIFIVSLVCRSIDTMVCEAIPVGTHFLWHILNAITLYLIIMSFNVKHKLDASL